MRKGYIINASADEVKAVIEKALKAKGVKLAVLNEFTNMANADFPNLGYAWFSWRAKDAATTSLMIETRSRDGVDAAYDLLFKGKKAKVVKKIVAEKAEKQEVSEKKAVQKKSKGKTGKKKKIEEKAPDNGTLSIEELGLKGSAAKAFVKAAKCKTLADVAKLKVAELEAMPGVGPKTIEKIVEAMANFGFELK